MGDGWGFRGKGGLLHCCWSAKKARSTRPTRTREKIKSAVVKSLPRSRDASRMMYVGVATEKRRSYEMVQCVGSMRWEECKTNALYEGNENDVEDKEERWTNLFSEYSPSVVFGSNAVPSLAPVVVG